MGNRKNKSRSQKRKFTGNRFTERTKSLDVSTISEQKLKTTSVSSENTPSKDDKIVPVETRPTEIQRRLQERFLLNFGRMSAGKSVCTGEKLEIIVNSKSRANCDTIEKLRIEHLNNIYTEAVLFGCF
ncbi:hypothetical protein TNIN_272941 [Trichonephila inaurata madagascariensis]|uniref:Uncharacterized protein n=1 Tax=Trichonephila inaurata madagascariensis TaxID=2747483 RepID=A0A8X6Y484_9ARAC|nr:hypothetical protein TNIN_272941 [Trichonephila inaurata madagascariensis]